MNEILKPVFLIFAGIMVLNWINVLRMRRKVSADPGWAKVDVPGFGQFGIHLSRNVFVKVCTVAGAFATIALGVFGIILWK